MYIKVPLIPNIFILSPLERKLLNILANFRYDKDNELAECRSTSYTANSVVNKWTVSGASCVDNVTSALGAGRGDYSLYYNGNINNTDTIVIYCDHNGVITKN